MGIQSGFSDLGTFLALLTTLSISQLTHWTVPLYIWACIGVLGFLTSALLSRHLNRDLVIVHKNMKKSTPRELAADAFNRIHGIRLLLPAFIISGASWNIIMTFFPLLLSERTLLSLPVIGSLVALWAGIGSIVSLSYGRIRSYINRKKIMILSYGILGALNIILIVFTQLILLIIIMILLGIVVFMTYPALMSFVSEVTDESAEGWTFGLTFTFQTGGGTILLFLSGVLSDYFGIWMPFAILGVLSLIFTCVLLLKYQSPFAQPI
jgi:MFS family permease